MRVITGSAKGRKLSTPKDDRIRPTTDRIKESLFNIISPYVKECSFLDCFSGTGSIGIEAISRGASAAYFIDNHKESIQVIEKNLISTGFYQKDMVLSMDIQKGLRLLSTKNIKFDIIFMDPPYQQNIIPQTIENIMQYNLLNEEGIIIAEHDKKDKLENNISHFHIKESRTFGSTAMTIYEKKVKK